MTYHAPLDDIRFVLHRLVGIDRLAALPGLDAASPELVDQILEEAARFAEQELAPLNAPGDREGARLENGRVFTPAGFADAYQKFVDGGWPSLPFAEETGGQGLPWTLAAAVGEMWHSANMAFAINPLLTEAAADLLVELAPEHAQTIACLVSGRWTGAMCLTEAHAGTDLGALKTRAVPDGDRFRLHGTKTFISYGDHDLAENIVYLVLARLPDAPPGTRGLSLFLVPKFLPGEDGRPGARNDVRCTAIEHKLGIHASPTCVMSFGDDDGAIGWQVGPPHGGMRAMFLMMNHARLTVGLEGLAIAERAFQQALAYAGERIQGQWLVDGRLVPARIVEHPDVRRMLVAMQARIEAMRALVYTTAAESDVARRADDEATREAARRQVDLLTPIVKAWCTETGFEVTSDAIQVHGGAGYVEETGAAQHLRDARINMIYEGANGIQALDLATRKLQIEDGRLPWELFALLRPELASFEDEVRRPLAAGLDALEGATRWLQEIGGRDPDAVAAGATPYLRMFGTVQGGFLLARAARIAAEAGDPLAEGKAARCRFYTGQLVPLASALLPAVTAGADVLRSGLD
jgi:alkylation response protein AidB-like acyl-CoA dehydrogenase